MNSCEVGISLNINKDETCRLAGELARLTGEAMTDALRERLECERSVETLLKETK